MTPRPSNRRGRPDSGPERLIVIALVTAIAVMIGAHGLAEILADLGGGR